MQGLHVFDDLRFPLAQLNHVVVDTVQNRFLCFEFD